MRIYFYILFLVATFLIVLPVCLSLGIQNIPNNFQSSLSKTINIDSASTIKQFFVSPENRLNGLGMSIKNPNYANKTDLVLQLYDENDNLVRTVAKSGSVITDGGFIKFIFEPIPNSRGRKYSFVLLALDSNPKEPFSIFVTKEQSSQALGLLVGQKPRNEQISFVSYYKTNSIFATIYKIYYGFITKLMADPAFTIVYLSIIVLGLGYIIKEGFAKPLLHSCQKFAKDKF